MKSKIKFVDEKLERKFSKLDQLRSIEKELHKHLLKAFENIENNAHCGIQIPKKLIPKEYEIDNLWKYNLPNGWRLLYTIKKEEIIIVSIILEWINHKKYERKFKY